MMNSAFISQTKKFRFVTAYWEIGRLESKVSGFPKKRAGLAESLGSVPTLLGMSTSWTLLDCALRALLGNLPTLPVRFLPMRIHKDP